MKTKEEAFLIHYLHYTVGFGREAAWGSKKKVLSFYFEAALFSYIRSHTAT
ncbi:MULTISPECIES: hypothetical protein [Trichococcus]|uniref:hypothetical protein n=1 Tax=Trichococcus TaxID=82802 RepID=UPI0012EED6B4|nr:MULTISPECIES: hypothetical protein [Trichococcus]HRA70054.1 hypothetical protein [Trichococcus flocculiformis]